MTALLEYLVFSILQTFCSIKYRAGGSKNFLVRQISGADLCIGFAKGAVLTGRITLYVSFLYRYGYIV